MASQARQKWVEAKTKAGTAVDKLKLKDDYGPMLDTISEMDKKLLSYSAALDKMLDQYEIAIKKLDGIRKVYELKIETEIKTTSDAATKEKLKTLQKSVVYGCLLATSETINIQNTSINAAEGAKAVNKLRQGLFT